MKMKKMKLFLIMGWICSSVVWGGYEISDTYYGGMLTLENQDTLIVTGGGANSIRAFDSSSIEIKNTLPLQIGVGGLYGLLLYDNSMMNYQDGEMGSFRIYENARAIFEGGRIDYLSSYQDVFDVIIGWEKNSPIYNTHIEIICKDYEFDISKNRLKGTWGDDSTFNIKLLDQDGYDPVIDNIKFTLLPEPATLVLLALGGMAIRRRGLLRD